MIKRYQNNQYYQNIHHINIDNYFPTTKIVHRRVIHEQRLKEKEGTHTNDIEGIFGVYGTRYNFHKGVIKHLFQPTLNLYMFHRLMISMGISPSQAFISIFLRITKNELQWNPIMNDIMKKTPIFVDKESLMQDEGEEEEEESEGESDEDDYMIE